MDTEKSSTDNSSYKNYELDREFDINKLKRFGKDNSKQ